MIRQGKIWLPSLLMDSKSLDRFKRVIRGELREHRTSLGLSMNRLAEESGLSQQTISYLERGLRQPSLESLARICDALGIPLSDFIRQAEEKCIANSSDTEGTQTKKT